MNPSLRNRPHRRSNMRGKDQFNRLSTPFSVFDQPGWDTYPRPQMQRNSYIPLNGEWELSVIHGTETIPVGTIRLPFPPESELSGICRTLKKGEKWLYRRKFTLSESPENNRLLLHFGAADQIARVTVNAHSFPAHIGGYLPFSFDITDYVRQGDNIISAEITDTLDPDLPYGKQRTRRGGMWYTPISGIWQPVWMEYVPQNAFSSLKITPDLCGITLETTGGNSSKTVTVSDGAFTKTLTYTGNSLRIEVENPILWTPENPHLYSLTLTDGKDTVESYFALRTVSTERRGDSSYICLNGKPYFFHALLDQGYFSDGIYTPASPEALKQDILKAKALGFNTLRKHIKIEPDLFYHYCDVYGMIVFQDMVNSGRYSFLRDTALPTVGLKKDIFPRRVSRKRKEIFSAEAQKTAEQLYNHPSVCYYTIFNEGWGQHDANRLYTELKKQDPTRIWDTVSGWFRGADSDVDSEHVYFRTLDLHASSERPLVLSEFGGYSCRIPDHSFNPHKNYGYRFFTETDKLQDAILHLYRDEVIPMIRRGLCAAVLTQISDVEDETNGLLTYDRKVCKVQPEVMLELSNELRDEFVRSVSE